MSNAYQSFASFTKSLTFSKEHIEIKFEETVHK